MSAVENDITPATRRRGRPKVGEAAPGRQQIVDAAVRAVRRVGPSVTMSDIADEAGVTKPIIYREIGDKAAVAEVVAEFLSLGVSKRTRQVLVQASNNEEKFRAATHMFFNLIWEERQLFSFVEYGWGSHDGLQLEVMIERASVELMVPGSGVFDNATWSEERRRTWAYATVGALRTVAVMWVRQGYCSSEQLVDDLVDFVVRRPET